jgi:hypothetical protein
VGRAGVALVRWVAVAVVAAVVVAAVVVAVAGCGSERKPGSPVSIPASLVAEARPIGRGVRFDPAVRGRVLGQCRQALGPRSGVHVEVFAADRVVLLGAGIGTRPPRRFSYGRVTAAGCYGELVTLEPTGLLLLRPGARLSVGDLFRSWGQSLTAREMAGFRVPAGSRVRAYVSGRRWTGPVARIPLVSHAEIVLEIGPYVPPHSAYSFPPGT